MCGGLFDQTCSNIPEPGAVEATAPHNFILSEYRVCCMLWLPYGVISDNNNNNNNNLKTKTSDLKLSAAEPNSALSAFFFNLIVFIHLTAFAVLYCGSGNQRRRMVVLKLQGDQDP